MTLTSQVIFETEDVQLALLVIPISAYALKYGGDRRMSNACDVHARVGPWNELAALPEARKRRGCSGPRTTHAAALRESR